MEELIILCMGVLIATAIMIVTYFLLRSHHRNKKNTANDINAGEAASAPAQRNPSAAYYQQQQNVGGAGAVMSGRPTHELTAAEKEILDSPYNLARESHNGALNGNLNTLPLINHSELKKTMSAHLGLY